MSLCMIATETFAQVEAASPQVLWDWLAANNAQPDSVWLVTWKRPSPKYVSREEVLDALIAYGWIDGIRRKREDGRTMQLISPRKQQAWAKSYKDRVARLRAEGRMRAPGEAAVAAGKASGKWSDSDPVDALVVPKDLGTALGPQRAAWDALAPSYRRNVLRWIAGARRPETRAKRVAEAARATAEGRRIPQM